MKTGEQTQGLAPELMAWLTEEAEKLPELMASLQGEANAALPELLTWAEGANAESRKLLQELADSSEHREEVLNPFWLLEGSWFAKAASKPSLHRRLF